MHLSCLIIVMPFRQYSVFLIFSIRNEIDFTEHQWPTRPTCNIFSSDLHMFQLKLAPPEVSDFVEVWEKCSKVVNFNLKEGQIDLLSKVRPRATQKKMKCNWDRVTSFWSCFHCIRNHMFIFNLNNPFSEHCLDYCEETKVVIK